MDFAGCATPLFIYLTSSYVPLHVTSLPGLAIRCCTVLNRLGGGTRLH